MHNIKSLIKEYLKEFDLQIKTDDIENDARNMSIFQIANTIEDSFETEASEGEQSK